MNFVRPIGPNSQAAPTEGPTDRRLLRLIEDSDADEDFWSSKSRDRRDSAHCMFQYPAMMVPLVQRRLLALILDARPATRSLYDPFAGSGTSLVSGMHFALDVFGNDINPLAVLISRVRSARAVDPSVGDLVVEVVREARADRGEAVECDFGNLAKWFRAEVSVELSRLRRAIRRQPDLWVRRFLWVTLAETVRLTSNDRTSTYKLHVRPAAEVAERTPSPIATFEEIGRVSAESFSEFRAELGRRGCLRSGVYRAETCVDVGDIRDAEAGREGASYDLIMTSPPYGDNLTTVTYGQHSYLPLLWIDYSDIDEHADPGMLRTTQEIDRRSLGGAEHEARWAEERLWSSSPTLKTFADLLPSAPADGRARLVRFYCDFAASLARISDAANEDAYMVWTVGNRNIGNKQVPTHIVLEELLAERGCTVLKVLTRRIHHKRMPDRNANSATMREEKILLARKLGR